MDYNLHPKTQRVQQLHEKKHLGHDPTTSCENVRYITESGPNKAHLLKGHT